MPTTHAYRIAVVFVAWMILRGLVPGFAETGEDRIYWADMDGIYWSNLGEGTKQRIITADRRRPGRIAVDVAGGKMYWVDKRSGTIQWSDLDGSNSAVLVEPEGRALELDLDLDLSRGKIYFSAVYSHGDYFDGGLYRANLDGSEVESLSDAMYSTLALDPVRDFVYLAWDGIYRLDREGSGREVVLRSEYPRDIALDLVDDKVYWTDPEDRAIRRSNHDGSDVEDVLTDLEDTPGEIGVDPEGGKVYWTLLYDHRFVYESYGGILRANLDGSDVEYVVERAEVVGLTLDPEGSKLYWTDARGTIQRANFDGSNVEDLFAPPVRAPYAVALDATEGRIYWTDLLSSTVQKADVDGSEHEILVEGLDTPRGVGLGGGRLYWADSGAGKIQSARLDGSALQEIATDLNHPDKVALDSVHGRIYWTERDRRLINRVHLDGSNIERFSVDGYPEGIALDVSGRKVYWTWSSGDETGLRRSSLEGTDVEDLVASDDYFEDYRAVALDLVGGKIHWTNVYTPPGPDPIHEGPNATVGVLRADLDGSNAEELAWLSGAGDMWYQTGLKVNWLEFMGNALALDLSHRTAVSTPNSAPLSTALRRNHPNPFNGSTLISYTLAAPGPVSLVVYNTLGQPVQTLVDKVQAPGLYSVPWQPAEALASGVYLYRLTTSEAVLTSRLTLLR